MVSQKKQTTFKIDWIVIVEDNQKTLIKQNMNKRHLI
jgi:hypothetical protein